MIDKFSWQGFQQGEGSINHCANPLDMLKFSDNTNKGKFCTRMSNHLRPLGIAE